MNQGHRERTNYGCGSSLCYIAEYSFITMLGTSITSPPRSTQTTNDYPLRCDVSRQNRHGRMINYMLRIHIDYEHCGIDANGMEYMDGGYSLGEPWTGFALGRGGCDPVGSYESCSLLVGMFYTPS
jgi:hypothetical protein